MIYHYADFTNCRGVELEGKGQVEAENLLQALAKLKIYRWFMTEPEDIRDEFSELFTEETILFIGTNKKLVDQQAKDLLEEHSDV